MMIWNLPLSDQEDESSMQKVFNHMSTCKVFAMVVQDEEIIHVDFRNLSKHTWPIRCRAKTDLTAPTLFYLLCCLLLHWPFPQTSMKLATEGM